MRSNGSGLLRRLQKVRRWPGQARMSPTSPTKKTAKGQRERHRRRPAPFDLHLLPPGAGARGPRRADACAPLAGLTTVEIARALSWCPSETMAKRLVRAKHKIRDAGIPYRVPAHPFVGRADDRASSGCSICCSTKAIRPTAGADLVAGTNLCARGDPAYPVTLSPP